VEYTLKNVTSDPEALREFRQRGYLLPPVTLVDGQVVAGFDPQVLDTLLFPDIPAPD